MKKYLLVCWNENYPAGGLNNIKFSSDKIEECELIAYDKKEDLIYWYDRVDIYDRDTIQLVKNIK